MPYRMYQGAMTPTFDAPVGTVTTFRVIAKDHAQATEFLDQRGLGEYLDSHYQPKIVTKEFGLVSTRIETRIRTRRRQHMPGTIELITDLGYIAVRGAFAHMDEIWSPKFGLVPACLFDWNQVGLVERVKTLEAKIPGWTLAYAREKSNG